jgi:hypothetical protein
MDSARHYFVIFIAAKSGSRGEAVDARIQRIPENAAKA